MSYNTTKKIDNLCFSITKYSSKIKASKNVESILIFRTTFHCVYREINNNDMIKAKTYILSCVRVLTYTQTINKFYKYVTLKLLKKLFELL